LSAKLEKPPPPPKDSSADFLTRWDSWTRLANFGELPLAAIASYQQEKTQIGCIPSVLASLFHEAGFLPAIHTKTEVSPC
jgi:hypothetical protein